MSKYSISQGNVNPYGIEERVIIAVFVVMIFCIVFIYVHPYRKIAVVQASSTSAQEKNTLPGKTSVQEPAQLSHLPAVVIDNTPTGFLNSINTQTPQNNNSTSSSNFGKAPNNYNLQASVTNQDPNSLNISVPKVPIKPSGLTNLLK